MKVSSNYTIPASTAVAIAVIGFSATCMPANAANNLHNRISDMRADSTGNQPIAEIEVVTVAGPSSLLNHKGELAQIDNELQIDLTSSNFQASRNIKSKAPVTQITDSDGLISDDTQAPIADAAPVDDFTFSNQPEAEQVHDPLKFINKPINSMNSALDKAILKPTAKAYAKVTPSPVRSGFRNFFKNLREPWTAVNLLLQGKPVDSAKSLGRFTFNTITSLGFVDVSAKYHGVSIPKEDFGQTLAVWGIPQGPYLVLPILGPSTLRGTAGLPLDSAAYPPAYLQDREVAAGVMVANGVTLRAELLSLDGLVDPYNYELLKSVYLQNRNYEIGRSGTSESTQQESFDTEGFGD